MSDEEVSASTRPGSVPGRVIMSIKTHNWASAQKNRADVYNFTLFTLLFTLPFLSFWLSASPLFRIPHSAFGRSAFLRFLPQSMCLPSSPMCGITIKCVECYYKI